MTSTRIPPGSEELEFVENTRTGTVHVLPWDDSPPEEIPAGRWGDSVVALLTGPVSEFPDEFLCRACVRALGDQAARTFEHPQPGADQP